MIFEPPIPLAGTGEPAVQAWHRRFSPKGLLKIIARARHAQNSTPLATSRASAEKLRKEVDRFAPGTCERLDAELRVSQMEKQIGTFAEQAQQATNGVFDTGEAVLEICADLRRFVKELDSEITKGCDAYRDFYRQRGWGEVSGTGYIAASCPPLTAMNDFLETHARPLLQKYESACLAVRRGAVVSRDFQTESAAWVLLGTAWYNAPQE